MSDPLKDLIKSKQAISLIERIATADSIKEQLAANYAAAVETKVILMIITLAQTSLLVGSEWRWSKTFDYPVGPLVIQVTDEYIVTVRIGDDIVCKNWPVGEEMLVPGNWLIVCREALERWEADQAEKARLAVATAKADALRKQLANQIQDVRILSVDV